MKKSLFFASLIALTAILAVSCKKESAVDEPKPRFSYEVSGLVVTFSNQSQNADSYVWDFGDGATSTEKEPSHTYAKYDSYTVKLTAKNAGGEKSISDVVEVKKQALEIKLDGNFDDWAQVPADLLAQASVDDDDAEGLFAIKFCSNESFIYFYIEYDSEMDVDIVSMLIDQDDNPMTGYAAYFWADAGTECLIQGSLSEGFGNAPIYKFAEGAPQDAWDGNWDDTEAAEAIKVSEIKDLGKGHMAVEGSIRRSYLPDPNGKVFQVGVYVDTADWVELGALPAAVPDDETGEPVYPPLMNVKLN